MSRLFSVAVLALGCQLATAADFYAAPNGNDANSGTEAKPFATIQAGVNKLQPGDTLLIRGGVYRETVTFPRSGTAEKPITVKPFKDEKVTVTGCEPITGWTKHRDNIWKAPMPWTLGTGRNQVFCGGEVMIEARFPNKAAPGLEMPVSGLSKLWPTFGDFSIPKPTNQPSRVVSRLLEGQPDNHWQGALYYGLHHGGWSAQTGVIESSKAGEIRVGDRTPTWWSVANNYAADDGRGMIIGHMNALDQPGEWHWQVGTLYLIPPDGTPPENVEAKRRQLAFDLSGREHIRIEGLNVHAASMLMANSAHCVVDRCALSYLSHYTRLYSSGQVEHGRDTIKSGETGIFVSGHHNAFLSSTIRFSAGAGIYLNGYCHTVHNCLIDEIDYASHYLYSLHVNAEEDFLFGGHTLTYNTLRNTGRSWYGIPGTSWMGASRTRSPDPTLASLFAHNHGFNGMLQTRDAGCITGGGSSGGSLNGVPGQVIYNALHDCYDLWGMEISALGIVYLDAGTCDVDLHHNLLWAAPGSLQRGFYYNTACADIRERNNVFRQDFTRSSARLQPADFPEGKPFRFGHDFLNPPPLPKWPQLETLRCEAENSSAMSAGVAKTPIGLTGLRDGDWIVIDQVDFKRGWQSAVLRFASDVSEMNTHHSGRAALRHQRNTDPLILDCSVLGEQAGYDDASPGIARQWTYVYNLQDGAWLRFNQVPMGEGYRRFRVLYGYDSASPGQVEVRLDRLDGPLAATVPLPRTHKPQHGPIVYAEAVAELLPAVTGTHDVFVVVRSKDWANPKWAGELAALRLDLDAEAGALVAVDYLKLTCGTKDIAAFDFAEQDRQWQLSPDLTGEVKDGVFQGRILKPTDPYLVFPKATASLQGAPSVRIRMKTTGKGSGMIYFGTRAEPGFSADKAGGRFNLIADGDWHEYTVALLQPVVAELEYFRFEQYRGQIPLQKNEVKLEVRVGSKDGEKIGEFYPRFTGGPDMFRETVATLEPVNLRGPAPLCLVVRAAEMRSWQLSSDLAGEVKDGVFQGRILKPMDPFLFFPRASASLKDAPSVRTRLKIAGKASAVIYFATKAEPGFSADKVSGSFHLIGDGQWHEYTVEMKNPKWSGELAAIRLDLDGTKAGDSVAVDYITLTSGTNDIASFDFKADADTTPLLSIDWISLEKANQPMDMTGLGLEPLNRDGRYLFPEPTHRPLPPDTRRLPSRLQNKTEPTKK